MREPPAHRDDQPELRVLGSKDGASFQVIVLGPAGGPREDLASSLLVRAPQAEWRKSSMIAVDAGAHLASIIRILERDMPVSSETIPPKDYSRVLETGPFAGIAFPCISAKANALYLFREVLNAFLITHPHLDHLSAMAINTPALEYGREAKAIVALPQTIEAIKNHVFNDWLWPNLSDEGHGVGFVTYRRLIEGGNPRLGLGESRGYVNVCDGLATKCWSVSHGKCHRRSHSVSHQHGDSLGWSGADYTFPSRRLSRISDDYGYFSAMTQHSVPSSAHPMHQNSQGQPMTGFGPVTPGIPGSASVADGSHMFEPVGSSAFFIRNDATGHELLIFGDIEPDSVSISPRNHIVWDDAAGKIAKGALKAIFIECSYDDSVRNEDLYGHLCPRHLVAELVFLGRCVAHRRKQAAAGIVADTEAVPEASPSMGPISTNVPTTIKQPPTILELKRKRKRSVNGDLLSTPELEPTPVETDSPLETPTLPQAQYVGTRSISASQPKTPFEAPTRGRARSVQFSSAISTAGENAVAAKEPLAEPLKGVTVHIIHVKDTLMDGPSPGSIIESQCRALSEEAGLGCDWNVTSWGDSIWI